MGHESETPGYDCSWEIALACDIRLSPLFSSREGGSAIDFDVEALIDCIDLIDAKQQTGKMLVTARHASTMNHPDALGEVRSKPNERGEIEMDIVVAGQNPAHCINAASSNETTLLRSTPHTEQEEHAGDTSIDTFYDDVLIQETVLHELQHVIDADNYLVDIKDILFDINLMIEDKVKRLGAMSLGVLLGIRQAERMGFKNKVTKLAIMTALGLVGARNRLAEKSPAIESDLFIKANFNSPGERRAYDTEKLGPLLNQVITIK